MPTDDIRFEEFASRHLDGAVRLSREAGWPHRRDDWELVRSLSRGVAATHAGTVIATALATPFGTVSMANMIIVDPAWRGRGLGREIMERTMGLIQASEWRLIATEEGMPLYRKQGFEPVGAIVQHQGAVLPVTEPEGVRWAGVTDTAAIVAMDAEAVGMPRAPLIELLQARGRLAVVPEAGGLAGYAALRRFGHGEVAGPVIARDLPTAQRLLAFFFARRTAQFLRVDTQETSGLARFLDASGLAQAGDGIAMRRGTAGPAAPSHFGNFALAAQALG